jgi:alpha-L-rhamnosidase
MSALKTFHAVRVDRSRFVRRLPALIAAALLTTTVAVPTAARGAAPRPEWSATWIANRDWQLRSKTPQPVVVTLPPQTARYVRLDVTRLGLPLAEQRLDPQNRLIIAGFPAPVHRLQLAEMEVRNSADPTVNLMAGRGRHVTASESEVVRKEWEPALLADGLSSGSAAGFQSAAHPDPGAGVQVTVDLGEAKTFDRVLLFPRTDTDTADGRTPNFPVDYTVRTAADTTFEVAATVTGQAPPPAWLPPGLPLFAKDFAVPGRIKKATLSVSGLGVYVPSLNGERVGDAVLEPGDTDYADRVTLAEYDVTRLLRRGANALGIAVGNGTANALHTTGRYRKFARSVSDPQVIAQLEITRADGGRQVVATDATWRTTLGPTTVSSWYGGEDYDARREIPGWDRPGGARAGWRPVVPGAATGPLTPRVGAPVRVVERLPGTEVAPGVFDLGRNIAGLPEITLTAPRGTTIRVYPGESVRDGHVNQSTSNVGAPIWDQFTSAGGTRTWHPEFSYHGFRYLEVVGAPARVAGLRIMGDYRSAGAFDTSDDVLDGIHTLTRRAVEANMQSILTDCPSREKLGWLEQDHLAFDALARNYDVRTLLAKVVQDIADAQEPSGMVPSTVPDHTTLAGAYRDDPNWGGALVLVPLQAYRTYGDRRLLDRHYPAMRRYLDYLLGRTDRWVNGVYDYGLGDWITTQSPPMPRAIVGTFGVWRVADGLAQVAEALGQDPSGYRATADALAAALWARYHDPATGLFGGGGQGATALALDIGAVPADRRDAQLAHLVDAITAAGDHLVLGEISFPSALRVLPDEVVYRIARQTTSPSLGFQVRSGLTTLGETWDGGSGQSQNHFMLGALDAWLLRRATGIDQAAGSAGFRRLLIAPAVAGGPASVSGSYRTPYGTVATAWRRTETGYRLTVTVPPGARAEVRLPGLARGVGPGTWAFHA